MKLKLIPKEEIEKAIKDGKAKQIHLYPLENILKPRGSLQKESIGLRIFEKLLSNLIHWNDPKYADKPHYKDLLQKLRENLDDEVLMAWTEFLRLINTCGTEEEIWKEYWERRDAERN
ncbi:MAG: hypothetical protein ACFFG0_00105 [Candidatus Thorarchaeota archaeon]